MRWAVAAAVAALLVAGCSTAVSSTESGNRETIASVAPGAPHCGVERWAVKTGTDTAAGTVNLGDVHDTTVAELNGLAVPAGFSQDAGRLAGSAEFTVWKVSATLVQYKQEADSDYHLVLKDGQGNTMIAEIPDPLCVHGSSPFLAGITKARAQFNARYAVGDYWQTANVPVTVTGVGFFDTPHGQTGVARNAIELHPVLDIQFAGAAPSPS